MDPGSAEPLVEAAKALIGSDAIPTRWALTGDGPETRPPSLEKAIGELAPLGARCARRNEGLCFVTGEAGLIPRKDQHAAYEQALAIVRRAITNA